MKIPTSLPRRRIAAAVASLLVVGAVGAGIVASRTSTAAAPAEAPPTPVTVAQVVRSDVATWDEFSGRLEAVERVDVRSRVAGALTCV